MKFTEADYRIALRLALAESNAPPLNHNVVRAIARRLMRFFEDP